MAQNTVTTKLLLDSSQFQASMSKAASRTKNFSQTMFRTGRDLTGALTLPLAIIAKNVVDTAQGFDLAQRKIAALSGQTRIFKDLANSARELGASTIFTATEVSELQLSLRKLGKSSSEIKGIQETVLQFAQAMDTGLADSGEFIVQTMNRFSDSLESVGDNTEQAAYVADLFASAAANSAVDAEKLRSALNYVGAEASAAGFRLDETTAIISLLADRGFDASRGGTALRRILAQLAKEGLTAEESLSALFDSTASYAQELKQFGLRGAGPKATLSGLNTEFSILLETLQNSEGFLQNVADVMDTSLYASLKKVQSAAQELSIAFVDDMMAPLKNVLALVADMIRGLSKLPRPIKGILVSLGGFLAILGPVALGIGALGLAFGTLGSVLLANPIFAALAGLIALGTALAASAYDAETLAKALKEDKKAIEELGGVSEQALKRGGFDDEDARRASQLLKQREALMTRINNLQNNLTSYQLADEQAGREISKNTEKTANALARAKQLLVDKNVEIEKLLGNSQKLQEEWNKTPIGPEVPDWLKEKGYGDDGKFEFTPLDPEWLNSQRLAAQRELVKSAGDIGDWYDVWYNAYGTNPDGSIYGLDNMLERAEKSIDNIDLSWTDDIEESLALGDEFDFISEEKAAEIIARFEWMENKVNLWGERVREMAINVGQAFSNFFADGITQSKTWAESLKENLLDALGAVLRKVAALTIAFLLLNAASGGLFGGGIAELANAALQGQNLTQFIGAGFGFDQGPRSVTVNGSLAGTDIVLTNQRAGTALDRIYG